MFLSQRVWSSISKPSHSREEVYVFSPNCQYDAESIQRVRYSPEVEPVTIKYGQELISAERQKRVTSISSRGNPTL